ncbi:SusC/RagA family TonB-linked outer membrane protein [Pedobacter mucosus]|uniref:SusC/RagA family TonB-linked outer membrane protein n=1 Tax=Pedobacter mucosus TaxID=2895286 RepID=UPI001EE48F08|nr:TonB-dependent receptor [Pedobacter mucosus]UKT64937.1 TonB-dependent receptor [Pedobacter mucosus]
MIKRLLLLVSICLSVIFCSAQTRKITGTVLESGSGDALPGASIKIKGTTTSAITDANGKFTITVPGNTTILVISYIGFIQQEINVGANAQINVSLKPTLSTMDEVTIIGYVAQPKKDLTGSVTSLDAAKQLKDSPVNSAAEALTGRLAGVQITGSEGSLESDPRIVIRGGGSITQDNAPLYVIDGIQVDDGFKSLSPQDIERIDVLKDASATSIYGSRGANGVVLITTKSGKPGTAIVSYNGLFGTSTLPATLPVMSPYDFVVYQYERFKGSASERQTFALRYNTQPDDPTLPRVIIPNFADLDQYKNVEVVDWQREVMGNVGYTQTHNLSVSGGTTKGTRYNFSYTNNNQSGIVLNTDLIRNLFNVKLDQTVSDKFKLGFTLRYSNTANSGSGISDGGNAQLNGLRNFVKYKPYLNDGEQVDEFNEEYFDATNQGGGLGLLNPVAGTLAKYRKVNTAVTNFGGNLDYSFNSWLSIRATGGINFTNQKLDLFRQALRTIELPSASFMTNLDKTINQSNVLTYNNSKSKSSFAKKNKITALLGQEIFIAQADDLANSLRYYPRGITPELALTQLTQGTVVPGFPNKDYNKSTLLSFFSRVNYAYGDKYLATITIRADGSSKFAESNRWGYFPAASLAWRISSEKFMENVKWVDDVKLRLSYGASGNNRIPDYAYMSIYDAGALYGLNDGITTYGYQSTNLPNPNLKWETNIQSNIGLDFSFMKSRFQGSIDAYSNHTNDVITRVAINPSTGYQSQLQNTADTWNRGLEFQLSGMLLKAKKFQWNADFNISFNKNTVERLSSGLESQEFQSGWQSLGVPADYLVQVGKSVGNIYGFVNDGFYSVDDFDYDAVTTRYTLKSGVVNSTFFAAPQPGSIKIKDYTGDGLISREDRQIIGNAVPLFFGGINQQFSYGSFDASVFVNFSVGNDILNANKIEFTNGYLSNNNLSKIMEERWKTIDANGVSIQTLSGTTVTGVAPEILREANKNATIWQPIRSTQGYYTTDWAVEDGSFLRINNITIGYTFKAELLKRIKIKRARLYATANNLAVITTYSGYDPEVNTRRATGLTPGVDYSAYPRSRNFVFGLNISL